VLVSDLNAQGAMAALLKDAIKPNIVQTLEGNIAMVHGGPFANIAHGCNTFMATWSAQKLAEFVVTEAGYGADLGAEKFIDIKCRQTGLDPQVVVVVASIKALKYHGGCKPTEYNVENVEALKSGFANIDKHIDNIRKHYGLPAVVAINHFLHDSEVEVNELLKHLVEEVNVPAVVSRHWADGGRGATQLAELVVAAAESKASPTPLSTQRTPTFGRRPAWSRRSSMAPQTSSRATPSGGSSPSGPSSTPTSWCVWPRRRCRSRRTRPRRVRRLVTMWRSGR